MPSPRRKSPKNLCELEKYRHHDGFGLEFWVRVDVDIMKTSLRYNLNFVIIFLGNGDSDVMGVLSFNFVITTAAITVMVTLALPL